MGILRPAIHACSLALILLAGSATGLAEAAWTPSPQIVSAGQENVFSLQEVSGPDGTTSVVWDDFLVSPEENAIHLARIPLGGSPAAPVRLGGGLSPRVAAGPDGRASVVWTTVSGEPNYLAQVSPSGIGGDPQFLPVQGALAAVAIDANEVTTTSWTQGDALLYERISPSGVADPPVGVPESGPGWDEEATAGADREGNVLIFWAHEDGSNHWSVEMTRVNAAGIASTPVTLPSAPGEGRILQLKLTVNPEGDALLAWATATQAPQTPEEIEQETPPWFRPYTYSSYFELVPHGALSGVARQVATAEGEQVTTLTPALYDDGRGLLVARLWHGGEQSLEAVPLDGSGTAGTPVAVQAPAQNLGPVAVEIDARGVATVAWLEGAETVQMMASRIRDGGKPGAPVSLATGSGLSELASTIDLRGDVTLATTSGGGTPITTRQWINPSNCLDGTASTGEEVTTLLTLHCDDAGAVTYILETAPAHGTATVNGATGVVTYTPETGFTGTDTFTFKTTSEAGESQLGTFTITVEPSPPAKAVQPPTSAPAVSALPAPSPPPGLSGLRLSRTVLPRKAHRRHALMAMFALSASAHVTLRITRVYGRWMGSNCRRTPFAGHRYQRRCDLSQPAVTQSLGTLSTGEHQLMIPASTIRHLLRPGAYKLTLTASGAGGRTASGKSFVVHWRR